MSMPSIHDININISGNCNDCECCENDRCVICCCKTANTPKAVQPVDQAVQQVALNELNNEAKSNYHTSNHITQNVTNSNKKKCCVIM